MAMRGVKRVQGGVRNQRVELKVRIWHRDATALARKLTLVTFLINAVASEVNVVASGCQILTFSATGGWRGNQRSDFLNHHG